MATTHWRLGAVRSAATQPTALTLCVPPRMLPSASQRPISMTDTPCCDVWHWAAGRLYLYQPRQWLVTAPLNVRAGPSLHYPTSRRLQPSLTQHSTTACALAPTRFEAHTLLTFAPMLAWWYSGALVTEAAHVNGWVQHDKGGWSLVCRAAHRGRDHYFLQLHRVSRQPHCMCTLAIARVAGWAGAAHPMPALACLLASSPNVRFVSHFLAATCGA